MNPPAVLFGPGAEEIQLAFSGFSFLLNLRELSVGSADLFRLQRKIQSQNYRECCTAHAESRWLTSHLTDRRVAILEILDAFYKYS